MSSNYPHGFSNNVTIRNIPITIVPGSKSKTFWVDSVNGSNGNKGTFVSPFATIAYALTQCSVSPVNGDVIYVCPKHVETVIASGGLNINVPGVTIVFMGEGASQASINFTTAVAASVTITADGVSLYRPKFTAGIDALTAPISISAAYCRIVEGSWYDSAAKAASNCIVATSAATSLTIDGWKYYASTTGTQKVTNIQLTGVAFPSLSGIYINGDFSTSNINLAATCTDVYLNGIYLNNLNATPKPGIAIAANTTGIVKNADIRVASGVAYVSSVAKLNWDLNSVGYAADGTKGIAIGT